MVRLLRAQTAFLIALIASVIGVARDARACSPPPSGWFAWGGFQEVPENGVVILRYSCDTDCEPPPDPQTATLETAGGEPVPGTVALSGERSGAHYVVFKPEAGALVLNETYQLLLPGVQYLDTVTVVPGLTWSAMPSLVEEIEPVDQTAGDQVCCTGPLDSCGGVPCFFTHYRREAVLRIQWSDGSSLADSQYAFRVLRPGSNVAPEWVFDFSSTSYVLEPNETSTCYTLELKRLADDVTISYPERCVERPDDVVPGEYEVSSETVAGELSRCDAPPDGYEETWCEESARLCAEANFEPRCSAHAMYCEEIGAGGAAGSGGMAGSSGAAGTGVGGTAGTGAGGTVGAGGTRSTGGSGTTGGTHASGGSAAPTAGATASAGSAGDESKGAGGEAGADGSGEDGTTVYTKGCGCAVPGSTPVPFGGAFWSLLALSWIARRRSAACRGSRYK